MSSLIIRLAPLAARKTPFQRAGLELTMTRQT
jgi:hypothetical protein